VSDPRSLAGYGDGGGEDAGAAVVGSGDGGAVVESVGGSDVAWVGAGSAGAVSVGVVSVGVVSVGAVSVLVVPVGLDDDVVGDEPVGEGALLSVGGVPVGDAVGGGVVPGTTGGAVSRIATISALNASSWVEICVSVYDVIVFPKWANRPQTSPSASSCCLPGSSSTDSTSWLAIAAVMHWKHL